MKKKIEIDVSHVTFIPKHNKKDEMKAFLLRKIYKKWLIQNGEKIQEAWLFGRTIKVNNITGEIEVL